MATVASSDLVSPPSATISMDFEEKTPTPLTPSRKTTCKRGRRGRLSVTQDEEAKEVESLTRRSERLSSRSRSRVRNSASQPSHSVDFGSPMPSMEQKSAQAVIIKKEPGSPEMVDLTTGKVDTSHSSLEGEDIELEPQEIPASPSEMKTESPVQTGEEKVPATPKMGIYQNFKTIIKGLFPGKPPAAEIDQKEDGSLPNPEEKSESSNASPEGTDKRKMDSLPNDEEKSESSNASPEGTDKRNMDSLPNDEEKSENSNALPEGTDKKKMDHKQLFTVYFLHLSSALLIALLPLQWHFHNYLTRNVNPNETLPLSGVAESYNLSKLDCECTCRPQSIN